MTAEPLLVDTNILIHHWNGNPRTIRLLDGALIHISFVTEIEILGYHGYTADERAKVIADMGFIRIIDMDAGIKAVAIDLCAQYRMKLADAIIAATAIQSGIPMVTEDNHFKKLKAELDLIML